MEILPKQEMSLLPKPRHPDLNKCSREECQRLVDMASVRTLATVTTKIDDKLDHFSEKISSRVELMISNAVLKLKDELRTANSEAISSLRQELEQLKEHIHKTPTLKNNDCAANKASISENAENLHQLKTNLQKLYDAFNER